MHQWKFEAVEESQWFPWGVKTTYRAYCSDRVVEFDVKCKDECLHEIGQATGLEPRTLYVAWRPSVDDSPGRTGMQLISSRSMATKLDVQIMLVNIYDEKTA